MTIVKGVIITLSMTIALAAGGKESLEVPKVSDKTQKDFYRATTRAMNLQKQLDQAKEESSKAVAEAIKECGNEYTLSEDETGLICVAKPAIKGEGK